MSTLCRDYPSAVSINRFEPNGQTDWISGRHSVLGARETPAAQMDSLLRKWNSGKPMAYGRAFSNLRPHKHGVWEMKTVDPRATA
jgi:hypothetical protein